MIDDFYNILITWESLFTVITATLLCVVGTSADKLLENWLLNEKIKKIKPYFINSLLVGIILGVVAVVIDVIFVLIFGEKS